MVSASGAQPKIRAYTPSRDQRLTFPFFRRFRFRLRRAALRRRRLIDDQQRGVYGVDTQGCHARCHQEIGNSAAVRVPTSVMAELGLGVGAPVDVRVEGGRIVIEPAAPAAPRVEDLLDGVTPDNVHDEADFGVAVGREAL